jgi:signal peptide peptidase SppA
MQRFERTGFLAIEPTAMSVPYESQPTEAPLFILVGDIAVVSVCGPLEHRAGRWWDSYDGTLTRVSAALESSAKTVVLAVDSPGGVVSGMLNAARSIRAKARAAGKPLIAYVESKACSAGYCIASAADKIYAADSALIGSIGVLNCRLDSSANATANGLKFNIVTSGARKGDGTEPLPYTAEEAAALQEVTDDLADLFFAAVQENRGIDARLLEAKLFVGKSAKKVGLVDGIATFEGLLASLASGGTMSKYTDARSALEDAAKTEDDDGKKAQKLLAEMKTLDAEDGGDEEDAPADDDSEASAEADPPKDEAEGDDDEKPADKKNKESTATANIPGDLAAIADRLAKENAKLRARAGISDRDAFLATRPDLSKELLGYLKTKPLAECKLIVSGIQKPPAKPKAAPANATATVQGTRGNTQVDENLPDGSTASRLPALEASALRRQMGLESTVRGVETRGDRLVLGVSVPKVEKPPANPGVQTGK